MTKQTPVLDFSSNAFDGAEVASMNVVIGGRPSGWLWHFAGPGHAKYEAQSNRISRESLHKAKLIEQASVNRKKWVAPEETPDDVRAENVAYVVERLVGWDDVKIDGAVFAFSEGAAAEFLSNPKRVGLLSQALEFLAAEGSFTQRSATI